MRKQEREVKMQYWLAQQADTSGEGKEPSIYSDELHVLLEKAVALLPPQRKEVYKLKYQERLSYDEISARLNLSKNTIRNHMSRALEDIRAYLVQHAGLIGLMAYFYFF